MKDKENLDLVFDKVFKEKYGKNKMIFSKYQKLYDLPLEIFEIKVSKGLMEYCRNKNFFVLLLIYDSEGKVYMDRVMGKSLSWELPGSSIKIDETVFETIRRVSKNLAYNIEIGDLEPISRINNIYRYDEERVVHQGLVFIARLRNEKEIDKTILKGRFIEIDEEEIKFIGREASQNIIRIFKNRFKSIKNRATQDFQEKEIATNEKYEKRYLLHEKIMKKYILTKKVKKKKEFNSLIEGMIGVPNNIIDISCGDDNFICELQKKKEIKTVVGNDISWSQVERLNKKYNDVIFTNHNDSNMPFKNDSFEVAYCSNTLHHMPDKRSLVFLLKEMFRISKKIIIVEIEDPSLIGGIPHILNKYWYIGFLKDVGGAYLSEKEFDLILNEVFKGKAKIKRQNFINITGKYMIAEITKIKK